MDNPSRHLATATPNRDRDHGAAPPSSLDIANDGPAAKRRKLTMPAAEVEQPPISQSTCPLPTWLLKINEPKRTAEWLRLYFVSDDTAEMELNTILQAYEDTFAPYKAKYQRLGEPKFRKTFRATFEDAVLSRYALGTYSVQGIRPRDVPAALSTTPVPKEPLQRSGEAALPLPPSSRDGRAVLKCETNQTPVKEVQNHRAAPSSSSALSRARQVADERTINQAPIRRISYLSRSLPDWFLKVDEPKRSAEWLRLCFEPHPTSELGVNSLLQAYYTAFAPVAASHPHLVGPKFFALCRSTFTNVAFGSSPSGTYLIKGIKARAPPASSSTTLGTWSARSGEQLKQDEDRDGDKDRQNHTYSKPTSVSKALDFGLEPRNASLMGTPKLPEPQRRRNSSVGTLHSFHQGNAISGVPKHTSPWHGACENCRGNGKDHSFCYVSGKLYPGQGGRRVPGSGTKCGRCVKEGIPCVDVLRDGRTPDSHVSQKLKTDAERRATAGASTKEQTPVKAMPDVNEADSEVDLHYARMIHEKRISSETFSQLFRVHGIDPITTLFKWRSLVELSKTIT
ncbi:Chromatin structure-remodeling complex protein rsc9 [Extremus antarcticus]|uniref:Chromatin structure-remodeling complex protein rsc9 n=1 Tax=Extremus antarcticus TaxID=702011 RepID=A0AAJ0DH10_9PEZI|nr:Chromatin structure-remodeling complex protein rsc9 [Extremus antarcticus]